MMDGFKAFSHLCDNVPDWKERLKALAYTVHERHLEFTKLSRTASGAASLHRKRTGSTESLRPDDDTPSPESRAGPANFPSPPVRVEVNPDAKHLFQDYRLQAKRKRISGSITSNVSGPPRSRMSVIVYYDSAIQDGFEVMVRSIAGARNQLRKGKTAASMKARMAGMAMEESPFEGNRTTFSMRDPKIPRLTRSGIPGSVYNAEPYEQIDKELETAQTLCEIGAHQFLRDGNCQQEISGAHERIDSIFSIAQKQRDLYEQEAEVEAAMQAQREAAIRQRPRNVVTSDAPAVDVMQTVDGMPAVDTSMDGLLVDESYNGTGFPAVDPALTVDSSVMIAVDSDVAVDPSVAFNLIALNPSVAVDGSMAIDPAVAKDSGVAVDPSFSNESSLAVDPDFNNTPFPAVDSNLTVDGSIDFDHGPAVENEKINVSSNPTFGGETKATAYHYSTGPLEVDEHDRGSFHIDLTSFRRTRAM